MTNWSTYHNFGLYLVTDQDLCLNRPILDVVQEAVAGGVSCVQIREKNANTRDFYALAQELVAKVQTKGIPIIINDRVDIALAAKAAGVHLGQSDMPVLAARELLGPNKIIGHTAPTFEIFKNSINLPIQYLVASPVFETQTKKDTAPAWGIEGMLRCRNYLDNAGSNMTLMTIGGINLENAKEVLNSGVESIALVSALCSAKDVKQRAMDFRKLFSKD